MKKTLEEIARFYLNFEALEAWRNEKADDIPVVGMLSLYKAAGILDAVKAYADETGEGTQVTALDNLSCNFYTLQHMKRFITDIWRTYSLVINEDNKVEWDTHKYAKGEKHHPWKLKKKIERSINFDAINYCPQVDDELEDDVIVFSKVIQTEEPEETATAEAAVLGEAPEESRKNTQTELTNE